MKELRDVLRSEVVNAFKSEKQNLKINAKAYWEPVELLKNQSNVISGQGSGDDVGSGVLGRVEVYGEIYVDD